MIVADAPEGQKPGMPINVTVNAVSGGWVIRYPARNISQNFDRLKHYLQVEEPWSDSSVLHYWEEGGLSVCRVGTSHWSQDWPRGSFLSQ